MCGFPALSLSASSPPRRFSSVHSDYEQLGLTFKLFPFEVLFNRGLCLIVLERPDAGLADLRAARKLKASKDHEIVEGAIRRRGEDYMVFSIVRPSLHSPCSSV